jgi:hypothetical protein
MKPIRISAAVMFMLFATFAWAQEQREEPLPKQEEARPSKAERRETAKPSKEGKQDARKSAQGDSQEVQGHHGHPAGKSAHIPDAKFRASFGRQHRFVIKQPVIVEGQPRFQYSGYWFEIVDPWPAGWAYTDDCYIDYVDGEYFLFDVLHPGVSIALFVVM